MKIINFVQQKLLSIIKNLDSGEHSGVDAGFILNLIYHIPVYGLPTSLLPGRDMSFMFRLYRIIFGTYCCNAVIVCSGMEL